MDVFMKKSSIYDNHGYVKYLALTRQRITAYCLNFFKKKRGDNGLSNYNTSVNM